VDETQNQLTAADAARQESTAAVQSAEASAREARAMIAKAEADHAAAVARLGVAQADLARAETMLTYTEIMAPFDGVVTRRTVDTGHFVQPASGTGATPLLVVARTDKVRVFLDVPEMESGWVDVGDPATLRVQALNGKELKAPVTRTSWSLDAMNRSIRAEIDVPNDESKLRPGMYAAGTIELERRENVLTLPATAIVRETGETYCCVVESGKINRRRVELGVRSGPDVEICGGVDETNNVVLVRGDSLRDGQVVEILKPAP
jgi:RND family efflux transporter MFP subunit